MAGAPRVRADLREGEGPPDDPERMPAGRCRPGFGVVDLDAFHQRMLDHQVPCVQAPTMLFGARIAQSSDPDGLSFSVSAPPPQII